MPQWEYCTLSHNDTTIFYALYHEQGEYEEKRPFDDHLWAASLATLGILRWEAINASLLAEPTFQVWFFKRPIQPGNSSFTFT